MRGILPDVIRTRVGKGANVGTIIQSLIEERVALERLLRDPILAQLGCIDPVALRNAYAVACATRSITLTGSVFYTLAIETWLQVRSGRRIAHTAIRTHCTNTLTSDDTIESSHTAVLT